MLEVMGLEDAELLDTAYEAFLELPLPTSPCLSGTPYFIRN